LSSSIAFAGFHADRLRRIDIQLSPSGGTDAGVIHQSRGGVLTGIVSVPCRCIHSPSSTCRLTDFDLTWRLLAAFCKAAPGV